MKEKLFNRAVKLLRRAAVLEGGPAVPVTALRLQLVKIFTKAESRRANALHLLKQLELRNQINGTPQVVTVAFIAGLANMSDLHIGTSV